ncbi:MAG: YggS family pyridoxal phosphate-dependent enzyme [Gammaproteobacteria bacterium]
MPRTLPLGSSFVPIREADIGARLAGLRERIAAAARGCDRTPAEIGLVAVSKKQPPEAVAAAWAAGQHRFGESYLQEALAKIAILGHLAVDWHFIGRVQSNKTRALAEAFDWLHSLADLRHAERLSAQRPAGRAPLNVCLQVNLTGEASKAGLARTAVPAVARAVAALPGLRLRGLMTMTDPADTPQDQRNTFHRLRALRDNLNVDGLALDTLSMGMSDDLEAAICEGATLVRVGTAIFGPRD